MYAYHCIFSLYGFWLPNDPRGSGSDYIAVWELFRYGPATKTNSRQSVAHVEHDHKLREAAKEALHYPPVEVTGRQALAMSQGISKACHESGYQIHACAILPEHIHLVVGWHPRDIRPIVGHMKGRATQQLKESGLWYPDDRPVWGEHGWNVYLDELKDVERAIAYVEQNPIKEGKPPQTWSFVTPFDYRNAISRAAPETKRRLGGAALKTMEQAHTRKNRPR